MRSHTSSQVGTLFSEASSASQSAEFRVQARLSRICSSMLLRCFTMSLESPSSDRINTSITWWQWHTQRAMSPSNCYLFQAPVQNVNTVLQPPPRIFIFPNPLLTPLLLNPFLKATWELKRTADMPSVQNNPGGLGASLTTANCAQVKALGICSTYPGRCDQIQLLSRGCDSPGISALLPHKQPAHNMRSWKSLL